LLIIANRFHPTEKIIAITAIVYIGVVIAIVISSGNAGERLAGLPTAYDPVDEASAWRWFSYYSPYFRFAEFIMGAGAAVIMLKGWDIRLRPWLSSVLAPAAVLGILGLYLSNIASGGTVPRMETSSLLQSALFAVLIANARGDTRINRALTS